MDKGNIRFEQIIYASENSDAFEVAKQRLQEINMVFIKDTLLQLLAMDMNLRGIELFVDIGDPANHSPRFLAELNSHFQEFEEMQNDPKFQDAHDKIKEAIIRTNQLRNKEE